MAHYINADGVARQVAKRYENVGGAARQVLKAYTGVAGTARLYFAPGGVRWRKWSCEVGSASSYTRTDAGVGTTRSFTVTINSVWWTSFGAWSYSDADGFQGDYGTYERSTPDTIVGRYSVVDTELRQWTGCEDNGDGTYTLVWEVVGAAEEDRWDTYDKGGTDYGVVIAEEGALPEDGTLVRGDPAGSTCVVLRDGTYYYYEREDTA